MIRRILRALDKKAEVPKTSILEAMIMLKTAWDSVSSETIVNCFRKSGISEVARNGAMDENDDPFKDTEIDQSDSDDENEETNVVDDLNQDLDRLRKIRPDIAPDDLDVESFIDIDFNVVTNESRPLSVKEIVDTYKNPEVEVIDGSSSDDESTECPDDEPIPPPSQNEIDEAIDILKKMTLFESSNVIPLIQKISEEISKKRQQKMKQATIKDFFEKL